MTSPKSKEQVVPEDIRRAAVSAASYYMHNRGSRLDDVVAAAILAERERCVRVLEDDSQWTFPGTKIAMVIFEDVRELAAEAIRRPTPPKGGEE